MRLYDRGTATPPLNLRPQVYAFALLMERKLRENDAKKEHWKKQGLSVVYAHFKREVEELHNELHGPGSPAPDRIALEAADVGCLAMMIADCTGGLEVRSGEGEEALIARKASGRPGGGPQGSP